MPLRILISTFILLAVVASGASAASEADLSDLKEAAAKGDTDAQLELGRRYLDGKGVSADVERARDLFLTAARRGAPEAPFLLASSYLFASEPDLVKGYAWLFVAQSAALPDAAFADHLAKESRAGLTDEQLARAERLAKKNAALFRSDFPPNP